MTPEDKALCAWHERLVANSQYESSEDELQLALVRAHQVIAALQSASSTALEEERLTDYDAIEDEQIIKEFISWCGDRSYNISERVTELIAQRQGEFVNQTAADFFGLWGDDSEAHEPDEGQTQEEVAQCQLKDNEDPSDAHCRIVYVPAKIRTEFSDDDEDSYVKPIRVSQR